MEGYLKSRWKEYNLFISDGIGYNLVVENILDSNSNCEKLLRIKIDCNLLRLVI